MRKVTICLAVVGAMISSAAKAQLADEKDVTVTMDLQPVLELEMNTPNQINFTFDEINEYLSGIVQYGATDLKVSSTVSWDLYAVARSSGVAGQWDQQVAYSTGGSAAIPLSALELHQRGVNPSYVDAALASPGVSLDYSNPFTSTVTTPVANNSVFYNVDNSNTAPLISNKYIAGHKGTVTDFVLGGSYLTAVATGGVSESNFHYTVDYRIKPGLPALFSNAQNPDNATSDAMLTYAQPGVYTMYVQYILLEDQ